MSRYTNEFKRRVLEEGIGEMRGKRVVIHLHEVRIGMAKVSYAVLDEMNKALIEAEPIWLNEGSEATVLDISQVFNITFS